MSSAVNVKLKVCIAVFILFWTFPPQAYPWVFFREKQDSYNIRLDSRISYFFNKKSTFFSGLDLNYHNRMLDLDLGYTYSYLENNHYFRLSELAVDFPFFWKNWIMSIGFKNLMWSEADRYWNHGLWQARFLLDPLRPKQLGMPGVHFHYKTFSSSLALSLSYFYLPDVIIYPEFLNKKIFSRNPFFVDTIDLNIEKQPQLFQIEKFLRPHLAFQLKHSVDALHINFAAAYKGMNHLKKSLSVKGLDLSKLSDEKISLGEELDYFVVSHLLTSLELELELFQPASLFVSVFYDHPYDDHLINKKLAQNGSIYASFSSHMTVSVLAYFQEQLENDQNTLFTLGWTQTNEADALNWTQTKEAASPPANALANDYREFLSRDFDWKSAVSASIEHENKSLYEGMLFRLRANYALDNQFYHFLMESYFYLNSSFRVYLSGDLLLRFSDRPISIESSSITRYEGLNRVLLGGQYVF